jgi:glutamate--cysteine ligase catalytic subunit
MDTLPERTLLGYKETKKYASHIKMQGILYLIDQYQKHKDRRDDLTMWGDEIEYMLLHVDHQENTAKLLLKPQILRTLQNKAIYSLDSVDYGMTWQSELGAAQLESTPGRPFGPDIKHVALMEANMKMRRQTVTEMLEDKERLITMPIFPRTGTPYSTHPEHKPTPREGLTRSIYIADEFFIFDSARYRAMPKSIVDRQGHKSIINVPVFKDKKTAIKEDFTMLNDNGEAAKAAKSDHIYMDCIGFSIGCSLHVTMQAPNMDKARMLYDQLTILCPILVSLC